MGRGAAATLPSTRSLTLPTFRLRPKRAPRSPLLHDAQGVAIGASMRVGLLHHLRGAPLQDRNAIAAHGSHPVAMLCVFAGHGKHGARLAELAATVVTRHVRACLFAPREGGWKESLREVFAPSLERVVDDAFVEANIAVDGTLWSRNSGSTATVCLVRKGTLVVGTCGNSCVMVASKKAGKTEIRLLTERHEADDLGEKERVERFGGLVNGNAVSDQDERCTLPFTRSLGDLEMRSAGVCQIPSIRTFELSSKDSHVIVSSQPLWAGDSPVGPERLADVLACGKWSCPVDLAEALMKVAFGVSGPTYDATILCTRLR